MVSLTEVNSYLDMIREMLFQQLEEEAAARNPYNYTSTTSPGPRGQAPKKKRDEWECDCGYYFCNCTGKGAKKGQKKRIKRNKSYVKQYNKEYDDTKYPTWRGKRRQRAVRDDKGKARG